MITADHIAKAETTIKASPDKVWNALTDPGMINKYMFGTTVISDWKEGNKIIFLISEVFFELEVKKD